MDAIRRLLAQLRQFWAGLSRLRRLGLVAAGVGVMVALLAVSYLSPAAEYRRLASDLSPEEAGAMKTALEGAPIAYRYNSDGTAIDVPVEKYAAARVAVGAAGLTARGGKGYELFDETSLMTTPFVQSVNYQRALQTELSRSITQISAVSKARVMIARPDPSPFLRDQRPPTAGVVIQVKPGASLNRGTAAGIVALVARSVEGLKPENVTVVDSGGRLLSDPHAGDHDNLPTPQLEYRRELETYLATKVEEMLSPHLGAGRAIVRVSADINFQKVKERRETVYPDEKVASAERLNTSKNTAGSAGGVAGATSNVARAGGALTGARAGGGSNSSDEVIQTDYLISRSVRELEDGMGAVTRLNVAAMVDLSAQGEGRRAITAEDVQQLIKQAVGFRTGRDEVFVSNVSLDAAPGPAEPDEELVRLQRFQAYVSLARNVSLALAVVLALAMVPLLLLRRRRAAPPPATPPAPAAPSPEDQRRTELDRLAGMVRDDPARAAEVFRLLIGQPA
jgi:flagellar M-ring protein FliF